MTILILCSLSTRVFSCFFFPSRPMYRHTESVVSSACSNRFSTLMCPPSQAIGKETGTIPVPVPIHLITTVDFFYSHSTYFIFRCTGNSVQRVVRQPVCPSFKIVERHPALTFSGLFGHICFCLNASTSG